jgi:hypothetical protein
MASDTTTTEALSDSASRIHEELATVQLDLFQALSHAESLLARTETVDATTTEAFNALRMLAEAAGGVYRLSDNCRHALAAIGAVVDPLQQLLAVQSAEVDYWKRRALGGEPRGDELESANETPATAHRSTGIGSLLHEAMAARLDPALVAELETNTIARMAEQERGAEEQEARGAGTDED